MVYNWETSLLFEREPHNVGFITCKAGFTLGAKSAPYSNGLILCVEFYWKTSWLFEREPHNVDFITCKAGFTLGAMSAPYGNGLIWCVGFYGT